MTARTKVSLGKNDNDSCIYTLGKLDDCGKVLTHPEGEIFTPDNDGDGYYDNEITCDWTIVTDKENIVWLFIQKLDIEKERKCRFDMLQVIKQGKGKITYNI